jgi:hypothetical protein
MADLTIWKNKWTGCEKKWDRKRKAALKETEGLTGP